jgi:hypothetical protein
MCSAAMLPIRKTEGSHTANLLLKVPLFPDSQETGLVLDPETAQNMERALETQREKHIINQAALDRHEYR